MYDEKYDEALEHTTNPTARRVQATLNADDNPNPADSTITDSGSGEPRTTPGEPINYWKCCVCRRYNLIETVKKCACGHVTCWSWGGAAGCKLENPS